MGMGISDALEKSVREFSKYLLNLNDCKTADELEYTEAEIRNILAQHSRDVSNAEIPVMRLLEFLAESHGKSAIAAMGIDPFSMLPIVRLDGDEIMF